MARRKDKEKAIQMRLQGKTYSEIKEKLGVGKSTLSGWLHAYPLSPERLRAVRDTNPRRIEKFRNTMRQKREARLERAYQKASARIGKISQRELLVAGYYLYWAEGTKTSTGEVSLSNTDPAMVRFFIAWLRLLGVDKGQIRIRLHLYDDMNVAKETRFWVKETGVPRTQFRKPYIKKSKLADVKYAKGGFGHGTCNVLVGGRELEDEVHMSIRYIRSTYGDLAPLQEFR